MDTGLNSKDLLDDAISAVRDQEIAVSVLPAERIRRAVFARRDADDERRAREQVLRIVDRRGLEPRAVIAPNAEHAERG